MSSRWVFFLFYFAECPERKLAGKDLENDPWAYAGGVLLLTLIFLILLS